MKVKTICVLIVILTIISSCGIYSFTNGALPSHLKTVDIPLFQNSSLEPNIADEITIELNNQITSKGQLKIANGRGDATLSGKITFYENRAYTYGATGTREVDIDQYIVKITADVLFLTMLKTPKFTKELLPVKASTLLKPRM